MVALLTLSWAKYDVQKQTQEMMGEAARLEQENAQLEQKIDALGSVQSAEQIAQEELGMVSSDTVLIDTE
jgi:cell division protein FtsB